MDSSDSKSAINIEEIKAEAERLAENDGGGVKFAWLSDVEAKSVEWLWFPYIPRKKITLFTGEEGIGKSYITSALGAVVSNGWKFPNSEEYIKEGKVLFLAEEDDAEDTLKPRLTQVGAKHENIATVTEPITFDEMGLLRFENLMEKIKPALVFIDPFFSYVPKDTNINLATAIRPITTRLTEIAVEYNASFILVRHIGKAKGGGEGRAAGLGSIDLRAIARSEIIIGRDPQSRTKGAFIHDKCNYAMKGESLGYEITHEGLFWLGASNLTATQILTSFKPETSDNQAGWVEAMKFLREALKEGERCAKEVQKEAHDLGITERSLRTARQKLGVVVFKTGGYFGGDVQWKWKLPIELLEAEADNRSEAEN
ncbi:MAG TPA: AAA family ATPase [Pyrinomonadaceae bacterium]|jgi:hypothetical protein